MGIETISPAVDPSADAGEQPVLHCLGTTGYHPSPKRQTACYYIPQWSLVLDAGTGMMRLVEHLLREPKESLDILLTHAHLDHVVGLTFLLDTMAATTLKHVRVFGEASKLDAIRDHLFSAHLFPVEPPFEFVPLPDITNAEQPLGKVAKIDAGEFVATDLLVHYFPQEHPGGSLGYVLERGGKRLCYFTDTVARPEQTQHNATIVGFLRNADLLMHECYFSDAQQELAIKTGHSWLASVTEFVRQFQPRKTLLIHINPLAEVIDDEFDLSDDQQALGMTVAEDEMQISI